MTRDVVDQYILDTSAWNHLFDDPNREQIVEGMRFKAVIPTSLVIAETAAIEDRGRRLALLRLVKTAGKDNRPLSTPNQLIIAACQGYARRDPTLTLNSGNEADGAWRALNKSELADGAAQRAALEFNKEREGVFRDFKAALRKHLRPSSKMGSSAPGQ